MLHLNVFLGQCSISLQMDSPKEILDWANQMMQRKADRVKALVEQVLQLVGSSSPKEVIKLKSDVVDEMDSLVHDLLQCQCSLDKLRWEQELKEVLDWAIKTM
jgi:DNA helicase IV